MNRRVMAGALLVLAAGAALADTTCRISLSTGLAFGLYDPVSASPNDSLATVATLCTRTGGPRFVTVTLQVNAGANGSSVNTRRMANTAAPGNFLNYGIYRDVGRSAVWGFSAGLDTMAQTLSIDNNNSATGTFILYGRIPAGQDVAIGTYSDSVAVTIAP